MKCHWTVASVALIGVVASPCWGQTHAEVQRLRDEVQSLQAKLESLESAGASNATRDRTTQLGRSRVREDEPTLAVRIYDLSDLVAPISPYPAMLSSDFDADESPFFPAASGIMSAPSGMSGMGGMGGMMSVPSSTPRKDVLFQMGASHSTALPKSSKSQPSGTDSMRIDFDSLIDAITSTIEPTEWDSVGGAGSMAPLGNSLIVSTYPRIHEQITALLDSFRKRWGTLRTVSVQADWLWLIEPQLAMLVTDAANANAAEPRAFGLVDDAAWQDHMKEARKSDTEKMAGYHAVVTCYNGQTVHTASGKQHRFIAGMIPVVGDGSEAGIGYQPQVASLQEGAALQVTPMTTTGGKFVVLDVHSRVLLLHDEPGSKVPKSDWSVAQWPVQGVVTAIDRPVAAKSQLATTLRVPVDRRVLVGGMTFQAKPKHDEPGLYLFVKLNVQELRDDLPAATSESKRNSGSSAPVDSASKHK